MTAKKWGDYTERELIDLLRPIGVVQGSWDIMSHKEKLLLLARIKVGIA